MIVYWAKEGQGRKRLTQKFTPMIRPVATLLLLLISCMLSAQSLEEIKSLAGKNQWDKAKNGIEKFLAQPAHTTNSEAWQLKSLILYRIVTTDAYRHLAPNGYRESFEAYKRYLDLAAKEKSGSPKDHEILFGICFSNIEKANNEFQHKRYEQALASFLEVEEMEDYIVKKGLSYQDFNFPVYDTQLYVNIAASAVSARREDVALRYYQKIADKKIASKGFDGIYRYLVDRFDRKGDKVMRDRYLNTGRELYPSDPYWCQVALRDAGTDKKKILARYEELVAGSCNNYLTHYNYAVELYNYSFKQQVRPADFAKVHVRIPEELKKALALEQTVDANLLMCRYHLIMVNDLIDAYNAGTDKGVDLSAKKELLATQINQRYEEVQHYASNAYNLLQPTSNLSSADKEKFITACKMLSDYWERKNDRVKQKEYDDRIKEVQ